MLADLMSTLFETSKISKLKTPYWVFLVYSSLLHLFIAHFIGSKN